MSKYYKLIYLIIPVLLAGCATVLTEDKVMSGTQHAESFKKRITKTVECKYLFYLPKDYNQSKKTWPLILFLHGSGERGEDINKVKMHGPPMLAEKGRDFPFIVVSPQCPMGRDWSEDVLITLLDTIETKYRVDKQRVYLTGLSMGGYQTWRLAMDYPDRFAAIAPISGGGEPDDVYQLKNIPVWAFHGAKDPVVPLKEEMDMVNALQELNGDIRFTVYPNSGHNAWTQTYNNDELYQWFLEHNKNKN